MEIEFGNMASAKDRLQRFGYSQIEIKHRTLIIEMKILKGTRDEKHKKNGRLFR